MTILGIRLDLLESEKHMLWTKWTKTTEDACLTMEEAQRCLRTSFFYDDSGTLMLLR